MDATFTGLEEDLLRMRLLYLYHRYKWWNHRTTKVSTSLLKRLAGGCDSQQLNFWVKLPLTMLLLTEELRSQMVMVDKNSLAHLVNDPEPHVFKTERIDSGDRYDCFTTLSRL